jgi:ABC-type dipeptide/oligopeptide/nickel transport system permease subunit
MTTPITLMTTIVKPASPVSALSKPVKPRNLWGDAARRFARNRLSMVALFIIVLLVFMAVFADVLAPEGYDKQVYDQAWLPPSWEHPLGTDPFGRSLLSRIIHGSRISLLVGLVSMIFSLLIGLPIGAVSAWFGGAVDYFFMRLIDIISAVPNLLLAILIVTVLGSGLTNVLLVLVLTGWMGMARLVRGQLLSVRESDYVLAARCTGARDWRIISRHLLPNALSPIIVAVTLGIPGAILAEAGLSFLGVGVNPPLPSWGRMVNEYLTAIQSHPYLTLFPGIMIALTMYAFTLVGDGLQDALDPTAGK